MRTNTGTAKPSSKPEDTARQWKARLVFIIVIVGLLVLTWLIRYPKGYANAFLGHYVGTTSILEQIDGLTHTSDELNCAEPLQTEYDNWKQTHLREKLKITASTDETVLVGDFYDAGSDVTVIALHSFDGSNEGDYLYVPWYAEQAYNIFLPDLRSHGESEGYLVTWGDYESCDLKDWMDTIDQIYGSQKYILHGTDLGASAALWCADDERIAFIAAESPAVELYSAVQYLLKEQFGIPGFLMPIVDHYAKAILPEGRSMKEFSLIDETAGVSTPIIVLNAEQGTMVDSSSVCEFFNQYAGPKALISGNATHGMVYPTSQDEVETVLSEYVDKYIVKCR